VTKAIRVLLADDHPTLRLGLRLVLDQAPDIEVVGEAATGDEALALIEASTPAVAVIDCLLPGMSGMEVAAGLRERDLPVRVLALSAYADEAYVRGMLVAGALGYLLKEEAPGVIVAAVRGAMHGETHFSPSVAAQIAAWARGELPGGLTERELEVLQWAAGGLSNKEIAHELDIKERTVEFHVGHILEKLGMRSRVEAALWAKEQGIVP